MDKLEIAQMLEPYSARICKCISQGHYNGRKCHEQFLHLFTKRTIASITRDHIWDQIRKEFVSEESVKIRELKNSLCLLEISGIPLRIFLRFKKLNARLLSCNIPTQQVASFLGQRPLRQLTLLPCVHLNAGYLANESSTDIEVFITKPHGSRSNAWVMRICENHQRQPVIQLPLSRTEKPRAWKPKTGSAQAKKGADNEGPSND